MGALKPRSFRRSVLRAYVAELTRVGLVKDVRARLSPGAFRELDSRAPWCPGFVFDEIHTQVASLKGRDAVRELGLSLMHSGGIGAVLAPIISLTLEFLGRGPGTLFARVHSMASILVQGASFEWLPRGDRAGTVRIRSGDPVPEISWAAWEGLLGYAYEVAKFAGTVAPGRPAPDGLDCEIDVEWSEK